MATPNPIQPIQPVNLPSAAGINYGEGDVRHFAQGDEVSVPGLSNPTRELAERDNLLASKVNEVVQVVNNKEQFVPLPVMRTILPPSDQSIVMNYRIPAGFEARVLNAVISSSPVSTDIELDIVYNAGFGGSVGTPVVTTSDEFTGGVNFYQVGEFIVTLKNKGGVSLEIAASILLTLRPMGTVGSLLVGSTVKGDKGDPGPAGPPGPKGDAGAGGSSTAGVSWQGTWSGLGQNYVLGDAVQYDLAYTPPGQVSSFICVQPHNSSVANAPQGYLTGVYWDALALGGTGPAGPTGATGAPGTPAPAVAFVTNLNTVHATFLAGTPFTGDIIAYGVYANAKYTTGLVKIPGQSMAVGCTETTFGIAAGSPKEIQYLTGSVRAIFSGWGTITLPTTTPVAPATLPARNVYNNTSVSMSVCVNGSNTPDWVVTNGTTIADVICYPVGANQYVVAVLNPHPTPVLINISGVQVI